MSFKLSEKQQANTTVGDNDAFFIALIDVILCSTSLIMFIILFAGAYNFMCQSGSCTPRNIAILTIFQMFLVAIVAIIADVLGDDADQSLYLFYVFILPAIVLLLNIILIISTMFNSSPMKTTALETWFLKMLNYKW
jgi:hypothetical protein